MIVAISTASSCCCSSALLFDTGDGGNANNNGLKSSLSLLFPLSSSSSSKRLISCSASSSSSRNDNNVPKLEPFSRSKFDRAFKDPPLIEKSEHQLTDYCSTLEGDVSYDCWQAYFELKELEKEFSKEEIEKLIIEAGGVKSLIGCLHGIAAIHKSKKEGSTAAKDTTTKMKEDERTPTPTPTPTPTHKPDGLPKSAEELEEEEKGRMPDSPYTRLLRLRGRHPAWYSPAPDHETD